MLTRDKVSEKWNRANHLFIFFKAETQEAPEPEEEFIIVEDDEDADL